MQDEHNFAGEEIVKKSVNASTCSWFEVEFFKIISQCSLLPVNMYVHGHGYFKCE